MKEEKLNVKYISTDLLRIAAYNPRKWTKEAETQLQESIKRFGLVDPFVVNNAPNRKNIVIGGHFRLAMAKRWESKKCRWYISTFRIIEKEKELNIRLNKNTGKFDWNLLANFDETFLVDIGFSSEELDNIFGIDESPEIFDLQKELQAKYQKNRNSKR